MSEPVSSNDPRSSAAEREQYQKLLDDPYFRFLLARQTRSQTWAFLSTVGAAILVILGYAGFQFNSTTDLMEDQVKNVEVLNQKAQRAAEGAVAHEATIEEKLELARQLTDDSRNLSAELLEAAQMNVASSRDFQRDVFEQHKGLIEAVRQINGQAASNVQRVEDLLKDLESQRVPQTLKDLEEAQQRLLHVADAYGTIEDLQRMEDLNARLLKARSRETITLRKYNSRAILLPDISSSAATSSGQKLRVMFQVRDLGRQSTVEWTVEGPDGAVVEGRDEVSALRKYRIENSRFNVFPLADTGYEYEVEYVNFGLFVRDFLMIRVRPASAAPNRSDGAVFATMDLGIEDPRP